MHKNRVSIKVAGFVECEKSSKKGDLSKLQEKKPFAPVERMKRSTCICVVYIIMCVICMGVTKESDGINSRYLVFLVIFWLNQSLSLELELGLTTAAKCYNSVMVMQSCNDRLEFIIVGFLFLVDVYRRNCIHEGSENFCPSSINDDLKA